MTRISFRTMHWILIALNIAYLAPQHNNPPTHIGVLTPNSLADTKALCSWKVKHETTVRWFTRKYDNWYNMNKKKVDYLEKYRLSLLQSSTLRTSHAYSSFPSTFQNGFKCPLLRLSSVTFQVFITLVHEVKFYFKS